MPSPPSAEAPKAIVLRDVVKRYGRETALDGVCLDVAAGESFGLVGMNGAGKTTCIKGMLDFVDIDAGTIEIFGRAHRDTAARAGLAFLPERFLPPYYLTGRDFLNYMDRLHGIVSREDERERICAALDLDPGALSKPVREYSKGMAQKLGLAACFASGKALFVLDEPMSGLDPKARLLVKRYLGERRSAGCSIFFSTHMLGDVDELCDRMGILHGGRLRFVGSPAECRERFGAASLDQAYLSCLSAADD